MAERAPPRRRAAPAARSRPVAPEDPPTGTAVAWVRAALHALAEGGVDSVRVEVLARRLGVTKGSFYWHFTDRRALLSAMVQHWEGAATTDVMAAVEAGGGSAAERLRRLIAACFAGGEIDRIESALRRWGSTEPSVRPILSRIDTTRIDYVARLLAEHGLPPAAARARARLLYLTMIGEFTWTSHGGAPTPVASLVELGDLMLSQCAERSPARRVRR